jgi:hypothetical protein
MKEYKTMNWIEIVMEEYKTLRTESIESVKSQQTTLNIGTAIAGAVVIAGFNLWKETLIPDLIFLFFIPILCYLILAIWLGEVSRMVRAGKYIKKLENRISKEYSKIEPPLSFENWLRNKDKNDKSKQTKWNYISVISLFIFIAFSSILIGNYKIYPKIELLGLIIINLFESIGLATVIMFIYITSIKITTHNKVLW